MKSALKIAGLLTSLLLSATASAYSIDSGDTNTNVGGLDSLINQATLDNRGNAERNWIQNVLGTSYSLGDKYEDVSLATVPTNESPLIFAHELETSPAYFLIKIGGGNWNGDTHFLFLNETDTSFGVFSLEQFLQDCIKKAADYDFKHEEHHGQKSEWHDWSGEWQGHHRGGWDGYDSGSKRCKSGCDIEIGRVSHITPINMSVPEPSAIALMSLGLIGMYAVRRRKYS